MSASVAPAADIYRYTDGRWMTGSIFNIDTHNRILSTHSLRSKADLIDSILKQLSIFAARSFSLWEPIGRISAFFDSNAAVSTDVATPTPTRSGGQAFKP